MLYKVICIHYLHNLNPYLWLIICVYKSLPSQMILSLIIKHIIEYEFKCCVSIAFSNVHNKLHVHLSSEQ